MCTEHRMPASTKTPIKLAQTCGACWTESPSRQLPTVPAKSYSTCWQRPGVWCASLWCPLGSHQMHAAPSCHSSRQDRTTSRIQRSHLHEFPIHPWADLIELAQHRMLDHVDDHLSRKDVCAASQKLCIRYPAACTRAQLVHPSSSSWEQCKSWGKLLRRLMYTQRLQAKTLAQRRINIA